MESWDLHPMPPDDASRGASDEARARASSARYRIVERTEALSAAASADGVAAARLTSRIWRLPTFSRPYATHPEAGNTSLGHTVRRALRRLDGKFVVANGQRSVALPATLRHRVAAEEARWLASGAAEWIVIALCEPTRVSIRHAALHAAHGDDAMQSVRFVADMPYRLVMLAGSGVPDALEERLRRAAATAMDASEAAGADADADADVDWFRIGLCLPDAEAMGQMRSDAAHFYRWITGRLGGDSRDRYWRLEEWEQYTEAGRVHGIVVPELLGQAGVAIAAEPLARCAGEPTFGASRWPTLHRRHDRRPLVPPGYCFVELAGRIGVIVRAIDR